MTPPVPGSVRIFARHSVGHLRAGRWQDVPLTHPQLAGWLDAGLIAQTGPHGEEAPDDIPRKRCCGG